MVRPAGGAGEGGPQGQAGRDRRPILRYVVPTMGARGALDTITQEDSQIVPDEASKGQQQILLRAEGGGE